MAGVQTALMRSFKKAGEAHCRTTFPALPFTLVLPNADFTGDTDQEEQEPEESQSVLYDDVLEGRGVPVNSKKKPGEGELPCTCSRFSLS